MATKPNTRRVDFPWQWGYDVGYLHGAGVNPYWETTDDTDEEKAARWAEGFSAGLAAREKKIENETRTA